MLTVVIPADMQYAPGEYSLKLVLYQNNSIFCTLVYNVAFVLSQQMSGDPTTETQSEGGNTVHLYTVAEFYMFSPVVPTVGNDGYWYVNGNKISDGNGEFIPSSHTVEYDPVTNRIIIDRGRVNQQGQSIAQVITSLADALGIASQSHNTAEQDHARAETDHDNAGNDHTNAQSDHEAIQQLIVQYEPIVINGNVTNAPDEEDITSDSNDLLKLKDRGTIYGMGYIILRRNKTFAEQVTAANTIYEIRYDFDLDEATVTIPTGSTLRFVGGSVTNGTLSGQNTKLVFDAPFVNGATLSGTFFTEQDVKDDEIFKDSTYDTRRISSLFAIQSPVQKVFFSKHTYSDVETIAVSRNMDVDFGGSTINMKLDSGEIPITFLSMTESTNRAVSANVLDFVKLRNVTIVGNTDYEYNGTASPGYSGKYRRAIQLFKVSDVLLENVTLTNYVIGTNNSPEGLPDAGIYRYINKAIVVWGYDKCEVDGFVCHDCHADNIIFLVPNLNENNMALVHDCHSYDNFTGLLAIYDGRCRIYGNTVSEFDSSAFNAFCYSSEIYSNRFFNGKRSSAIDLDEDGAYKAYDVKIYDNLCVDMPICGITVCGSDITVLNNSISGNGETTAINGIGVSLPKAEGLQLGSTVNNPLTGNVFKNIAILNNRVSGFNMLLLSLQSSSVISGVGTQKYKNFVVRGNDFRGNESADRKGGFILLPPVQDALIKDNTFDGKTASITSASSFAMISAITALNSSYYWSTEKIVIDNNTFLSGNVEGTNKNNLLYIQDSYRTGGSSGVDTTVRVQITNNTSAAVKKAVSYSDSRLATGQTFEVVENNNINLPIEYDSVVVETPFEGKMKIIDGKPAWYVSSKWVDATGEELSSEE